MFPPHGARPVRGRLVERYLSNSKISRTCGSAIRAFDAPTLVVLILQKLNMSICERCVRIVMCGGNYRAERTFVLRVLSNSRPSSQKRIVNDVVHVG